jgi:hypothetical protein
MRMVLLCSGLWWCKDRELEGVGGITGSAFLSRRSADAIRSLRASSESSSFRTQLSLKLLRPYTKSVNRRRRLMKSDFTSGDLAPSTTLPARDWTEQRKIKNALNNDLAALTTNIFKDKETKKRLERD